MADAWMGWAGMALLVLSFLPATWRTIRRGRSELRLSFLAPYLAGVLLTLAYAMQIGEWPFIALNLALLALVAADIAVALKGPAQKKRARAR